MSGEGKVAIITGAGTGIGRACSLALLREGYAVVLAGRRPEPLQEVIEAAGDQLKVDQLSFILFDLKR